MAVARAKLVGPMCVLVLKSHRRKIWANDTIVAPSLSAAAGWTPTVTAAGIATTIAATVVRTR
jgi:hypothetical protein